MLECSTITREPPSVLPSSAMETRLNKALADLGVCSRRKADELIVAGEVSVNGKIIRELGTKVDLASDEIRVRESVVAAMTKERIVIALNKPVGVECTSAPSPGTRGVLYYIPKEVGRVFPVGRLDKDSRGLILLTNDGLFAYHLTHPSFEKEKEYLVRVGGIGLRQIERRAHFLQERDIVGAFLAAFAALPARDEGFDRIVFIVWGLRVHSAAKIRRQGGFGNAEFLFAPKAYRSVARRRL